MRGLAGRVARGWNRFWFAGVDGLPLGLTRVGIALASFVSWVGTAPLLRHYYTNAGEFPLEGARGWSAEWAARVLMPDTLGAYPAVLALFLVWGVAGAALLVGWRTRLAAWVHWGAYLWFYLRNPTFGNGGDEVLRLVGLYLALAYSALPPARRALSLDRARWLRERGGVEGTADPAAGEGWTGDAAGPVLNEAWTVRMIQLQIAVVYLVSGFWKVVAPPWMDGTALVYALGNPAFSRFGLPDWAWVRPLFVAATLAVAWWEFLFPLLVVGRRTRVPALAFGVALHLGILVFMYIGVFPWAMLACYPAFLTGDEARRLLDRVRRLPGYPSASRSASAPSGVVP